MLVRFGQIPLHAKDRRGSALSGKLTDVPLAVDFAYADDVSATFLSTSKLRLHGRDPRPQRELTLAAQQLKPHRPQPRSASIAELS